MRAFIYAIALGATLGLVFEGFWQLEDNNFILSRVILAIWLIAGIAAIGKSSKKGN